MHFVSFVKIPLVVPIKTNKKKKQERTKTNYKSSNAKKPKGYYAEGDKPANKSKKTTELKIRGNFKMGGGR